MANSFVALPVPAGDGAGAWVDTSALGSTKTISVDGGAFAGTLFIESSNDGQASAAPVNVPTFSGGTTAPQDVIAAVQFMRVRRSASTAGPLGAPTVKVAAEGVSGQIFGPMTVPAGDGVGAAIDLSAGGPLNTFNVVGPFSGQVTIEISTDAGVSFSPALLFGLPSVVTPGATIGTNFPGIIAQARVRRTGTIPGGPAPRVSVGSGNDTPAAAPVGPQPFPTFDITLSYGFGNAAEQQLPEAATSFWLSPRTTADTPDANQIREWANDQALGFLGLEVVEYGATGLPEGGLPLIVTIGGLDSALSLIVNGNGASGTVVAASTTLSVPAGSTIGVRVDGTHLAPGMSARFSARVFGAETGTPTIPSVLPLGARALFPPENLALDGSTWIDAVAGHLYNLAVPVPGFPPPPGVDPVSGPARIVDGSFKGNAYGYFRHYAGGDFGHPTYTPCMLATHTAMFAPSAGPIAARTVCAVVSAESSIGGIVASTQYTTPCFKGALNLPTGDLLQAAGFDNFKPGIGQNNYVNPSINLAGQEVVLIWRTDGLTVDFFVNGVKQTLIDNTVGSDAAAGQGFCLGNLASADYTGKNGWQGKICFTGVWPYSYSNADVLAATSALASEYVT